MFVNTWPEIDHSALTHEDITDLTDPSCSTTLPITLSCLHIKAHNVLQNEYQNAYFSIRYACFSNVNVNTLLVL